MNIWVDADACPAVIRDILYRAATRTGIPLTMIANQPVKVPARANITSVQVAAGFDVADNEIVKRLTKHDLVITADIPLASEAITKGAYVLSPRGEQFTADNIKARLNMRDFMETMRASGVNTGGPPPLNANDRKKFADNLDRLLTRHRRGP